MLNISEAVDRKTAAPDGPQAFRWRLAGAAPPPLTAALRVGMAARAAIYRSADARGLMPLPSHFHNANDDAHSHAFWLTEDADEDGRIDHVLLFAASGIPDALLPLLAERAWLELTDLGRWQMCPDWMGSRVPGALFGPAQRWVSATAYVTPLAGARGKSIGGTGGRSASEQLRWEVGARKLGARLTGLRLAPAIGRGNTTVDAAGFTLKARRVANKSAGALPAHWSAPRDTVLTAAELTFDRRVWGPLAFGFGAHFGLGLFEPADEAM